MRQNNLRTTIFVVLITEKINLFKIRKLNSENLEERLKSEKNLIDQLSLFENEIFAETDPNVFWPEFEAKILQKRVYFDTT